MFKDYCENKDIMWMLNPPVYRKILPKNTFKVYCEIRDAIALGEKIYVHPDPDIDGFLSAKCWDYTFKKLGYFNYSIGMLTERKHHVKYSTILRQIEMGVKTIIIVDSSTNDIENLIKRVCQHDVRLIIIDHHNTNNTFDMYPDNCTIINPKMESDTLPMYWVSAGVVNCLVCDYILYRNGYEDNPQLELFGYITMYSDICPVKNPYIAAFLRSKLHYRGELPAFLEVFWDQYSAITKKFITFKVCPLINAAIRLGQFDVVHKLFFELDTCSSAVKKELFDKFKSCKALSNKIVEELNSLIEIEESPVAIIGILPNDLESYKYNFLGFVASQLANKYDRPSLCVYLDVNTDNYIGSARDSKNRDLLSEVSGFIEDAEGHDSAFGVTIDRRRISQVMGILSQANLEDKDTEIVFDYMTLSTDREIHHMAVYNELAIGDTPRVYVKIPITSDFNITGSTEKLVAKTKSLSVVSFGAPLIRGNTVICEPQYNGVNVECVVKKD